MKKTDEEAFFDYHHKSKILPPNWTEKDINQMYFNAGIMHGRTQILQELVDAEVKKSQSEE
jgi:hypothetical protein